MKKKNITGSIFAFLGVLTAIGPQVIFPVCGDMTPKPACYYTGQAEIGLGIIVAVLGIAEFIINNQDTARGLSVAVAAAGLAVILIPSVLIGVCADKMMICHSATRPFLIIAGAVMIITGILGAIPDKNGQAA